MKDEKLTDCPQGECEGPVKRLLGTGAGIIFKGGGFYQTDYRSDSYKSGAKREADASKPAESKGTKESGGSKGKSSGGSKGKSNGSAN